MSNYEIVDPITGEMKEFSTNVDIDLIQDYNRWVVENRMNPPQFSPLEYAQYIEAENRKEAIEKAIAMIEQYNKGTLWEPEMLDELLGILRNEE